MLGSPRLHIVKVNDFLEGIGEGGGFFSLSGETHQRLYDKTICFLLCAQPKVKSNDKGGRQDQRIEISLSHTKNECF